MAVSLVRGYLIWLQCSRQRAADVCEGTRLSARAARWRRGVLAMVLLSACSRATAPENQPHWPRYGLLDIDAAPLPVPTYVAGADTIFLVAEVVALRPDSIAEFRRTLRMVGPGSAPRTESMTFGFTYTISDDEISMNNGVVCATFPCPRITLVGFITASELQLTSDASSGARSFRYARLSYGTAAP